MKCETASNFSQAPASSGKPRSIPGLSTPCAPSSSETNTPSACSGGIIPRQLSLPMCERLATSGPHGQSSADSHARTLASQGKAQASTARRAGSGARCAESSKSAGRESSSPRTPAAAGLGGCPSCGATCTSEDIPACRFTCRPVRSGLPTRGSGASSSRLPTPTASAYGSCQGGAAGREWQPERLSLQSMARRGLLPTPTVKGDHSRRGLSARSGDGLATYVNEAGGQTGPLAPSFLEWMMGWPTGYSLPTDSIAHSESDCAETESSIQSHSQSARQSQSALQESSE